MYNFNVYSFQRIVLQFYQLNMVENHVDGMGIDGPFVDLYICFTFFQVRNYRPIIPI